MNTLNKRFEMTPTGYRQIVEELSRLENVDRPEAIELLNLILNSGDRSQSAEYIAAETKLNAIEERIQEDKYILARATVISDHSPSIKTISLGSVVRIEMGGRDHEFTIVGEIEADPAAKKISQESPLGKALMGKKVGQPVEFDTPVGRVVFPIKSVR